MKVQINFGDIETSQTLADHVMQAIERALVRFADRVTRIEAHLRDDKKKRRGPDDHRCLLEARLAGDKPLAVEARADDIYKAVTECAEKLGRAVERRVERRD